ncbi:MAG: M20 family metallopeptidase [Xanthobacteraceae bacterium]
MGFLGKNDLKGRIDEISSAQETRLVTMRRDLHAHPELAFEEVRTAAIVAEELGRMKIPFETGIGRTGVVGMIDSGRPGKTLLIRVDMDALPIHEETGLPFASTVPGKSHACGHDIHTVTLLGVAEVLSDLSTSFNGRVKLMFQPAEETLEGAAAMIADGVLDGVDLALGMHNRPELAVGRFGITHGAMTSATDRYEIRIEGKGGHSARPYLANDPIQAAAELICQLNSITSTDIDPFDSCAIAVGAIHAGSVHNVIPDVCEIRGTVRTRQPTARKAAEETMRRLVAGMEISRRVKVVLEYHYGCPAVVNDDSVLEPSVAAIREQLGDVLEPTAPSMGAEDFSLVSEKVPSFRLLIGSSQPGRSDRIHTADFQPDEGTIGHGVRALSRAAIALLS